jgi:nicotinate phosphoribosyltransferase
MLQRAFGLSTDLYQLTMAAAYFENGLQEERGIFEMFVRSLPKTRAYLITAGLDQVLDYLQSLRFTNEQIDFIRSHTAFQNVSREFFDYLARFKFTGDVWAMPEGTACFAMEPMLRVSAPIIEAQLVETFILATMNFQTMIASKAARIATAAQGRSVVEFGTRRAHGSEAGLYASRAAYVAGCSGTSNVEAGFLWGVPTLGTLAHSFIMSFDYEDEAFRAFLKVFPQSATLLVDTYDTIEAVKRLAESQETFSMIRLDSGDLLSLSIQAREILDRAGKSEVKIFASGDLNEYVIADLLARGAKIDAFGVGTQLSTSYDRPALGGVYKLVAIADHGETKLKIKLSDEKTTYPGAKQVWRCRNEKGKYEADLIALEDEEKPEKPGDWRPMLEKVMSDGLAIEERILRDEWMEKDEYQALRNLHSQRLNQARKRVAEELQRLPDGLLAIETEAQYPVQFSERLRSEQERVRREIEAKQK